MIWKEYKNYLNDGEKTRRLHELTGNIDAIDPPPEYAKIWKDTSFEVQSKKASRYGLSHSEMVECLVGLQRRPYYLVHMAEQFGVKNIVEVGTAQGLQFYSFARYIKDAQNGGQVWSCDIKDWRDNEQYKEEYSAETTYCFGTSALLGDRLRSQDIKIDMFYIDADHSRNAVLQDVMNLRHLQTDESLWVFDDFDLRFGCYYDIIQLCKKNGCFKIYRVGDAASGNPNHQVVIYGRL